MRLRADPASVASGIAPGAASFIFVIVSGTGTPPDLRPEQQRPRRRMNIDDNRGYADGGSRSHQAVDTIHDTPMTRNERAAVFRTEPALQRRFSQIACLRHEGENSRRWPPA